ncbi:probable f-box/LRR-repeat protein 14 [Coccomyxa sp. Obi]|nr:probable f-box/LRR-repeat protein 14 [Coccomyxa sp. Obi]
MVVHLRVDEAASLCIYMAPGTRLQTDLYVCLRAHARMSTLLAAFVLSPSVTKASNNRAFWDLPNDLMIIIMSHLTNDEDRHTMRLVCRHWHMAVNANVSRLTGNMYWTCNEHVLMLPQFSHVASVNLSQCTLVGHIRALKFLPALKKLELNWCTGLTPASLGPLADLTGLTHLDISGCPEAVTDDSMRHLAGMGNSLEWLSLQGCPLLSSSGLAWLRTFCRLSYLDLSGTRVVNLLHLSGCTSLRRLRLSGCEQLADGAFHSLAGLPALADLDLRGSRHLMTATLLDDLARLPGLRKLDLEGSEDLTDANLDSLMQLTGLTHLNISDCALLTQTGLNQLTLRMSRHCAVFQGYS